MSSACALPRKTRRYKRLSQAERKTIVDRWELGYATINDLAEIFGVHRNTVGNVLRSHGAVKGCRAHETVVELKAELDAKIRRRARAKCLDDIRRLDEFIKRTDAVAEFMEALMAADRRGELADFGKSRRLLKR